ncbi:MAG: SNF2 helicase associated domain-containing protein, partial [Victivallales bacterium]|nr:SNF2 helicase associated domain-containing protein [Victivallales bacterium]
MDGLQDSIRALTTQEQWEGANSLFEGGGVMNVRISSRQVPARVVNDNGGLENVLVSNRSNCLNGRCSCSLHTQWCKHIIAVLLLTAREEPEFLKNLCAVAPAESLATAEPEVQQDSSKIKDGCCQAISVENLRGFLSNESPHASLKLRCETELPALQLSTQRLVLAGSLNYNGVDYSIVNMRKIVDGAHASGGMNLNVFAPQAQQAMQFLVKYARFSTNEISLESELVSDLFHCLLESSILSTPSGVVRINKGQPQLVFNVKERKGDIATVSFSLFISGRGILSENLHIITGRSGYWFGSGKEYWWLPGVIPFNWLRLFINQATMQISLDELSHLVHICDAKVFPCRMEFQELTALTELPIGRMKPVLTLDWHTDGLVADLQFDYGGKRVEAFGPQVLWVGNQFIQRDMEAEEAAMNELRGYGFMQVDDTWHGLRIKDKKDIYHFITQIGMNLSPRWHTFWTPQMRLNAMMASDAGIAVSAGNEGNGWFETKCDIIAIDGTPVPFQLAVEAVENEDSYIRLPSGAVIHLTDDVFTLLRVLLKCASKRKDDNLDFDKVHSVLLADVLEPYWSGPKPDWCSLRDYLLNPGKIGKLVDNRFMPRSLRGYQRDGVKWLALLEQNGFNGILADEMGLGKTIQALSIVLLRKKTGSAYGPSLVVCPSSLLDNWHSEACRFTPSLRIIKITGTERSQLFSRVQDYDLAITSYALLRRDIIEYEGIEFDYIILDEAQHIKNPRTANAHACRELRARHKLILTGTPMENSLIELWSLFSFLLPGYLGNMREFRQEYDQKYSDDRKLELTRRLSSMIR